MQKPQGTGKVQNIKCEEILLPVFPELLFGEHFDGSKFFDATLYLTKKDPEQKFSVEDFFKQFSYPIQSIAKIEEKAMEKLTCINNEGHQLIDGCLCYLFLSYVDPQFCIYCNDVMDELFTTGFVISDTHLIGLVKNRLSPELLKQLWKDETNMA